MDRSAFDSLSLVEGTAGSLRCDPYHGRAITLVKLSDCLFSGKDQREAHVACRRCASNNQSEFYAEINVHFRGLEALSKFPVLIFPTLTVCVDCGLTEFTFPEEELRQLAFPDPDATTGKRLIK
jgi:hypothetical protein